MHILGDTGTDGRGEESQNGREGKAFLRRNVFSHFVIPSPRLSSPGPPRMRYAWHLSNSTTQISKLSVHGVLFTGLVGLAISYALSVTDRLSGMVTSFTETEKQMVSVERAVQYIEDIQPEVNPRGSVSIYLQARNVIRNRNSQHWSMMSTRARVGYEMIMISSHIQKARVE